MLVVEEGARAVTKQLGGACCALRVACCWSKVLVRRQKQQPSFDGACCMLLLVEGGSEGILHCSGVWLLWTDLRRRLVFSWRYERTCVQKVAHVIRIEGGRERQESLVCSVSSRYRFVCHSAYTMQIKVVVAVVAPFFGHLHNQ